MLSYLVPELSFDRCIALRYYLRGQEVNISRTRNEQKFHDQISRNIVEDR